MARDRARTPLCVLNHLKYINLLVNARQLIRTVSPYELSANVFQSKCHKCLHFPFSVWETNELSHGTHSPHNHSLYFISIPQILFCQVTQTYAPTPQLVRTKINFETGERVFSSYYATDREYQMVLSVVAAESRKLRNKFNNSRNEKNNKAIMFLLN